MRSNENINGIFHVFVPGNAFSCNCDSGASGGRTGVGDTSGMMLTSPGRFVEYGSRITFNDVHLMSDCMQIENTRRRTNNRIESMGYHLDWIQ